MADYFVDDVTGDNGDNGTTFDLAWSTVEYALESGGLSAGDIVHVRPNLDETPLSDISPIYDGTVASPIEIRGWSRAAILNTTITQADFTNGSKIIDNVVGITPARVAHTNRYITAPDGEAYYVTAVIWEAGFDEIGAGDAFAVGDILTNVTQTKKGKVWACAATEGTDTLQYVRDSATAWVNNDNITSDGGGDGKVDVGGETAVGFLLSREYAGGTVSGVNGKYQIDADPNYAADQAIDDSAWVIKKTDWDANNPSLPTIDFNDTNFQISLGYDACHIFENFEFKDSLDTYFIYLTACVIASFIGCLFKQTVQNKAFLRSTTTDLYLVRCILEGSGSGDDQKGIYPDKANMRIKDTVVCNMGDYGIDAGSGRIEYDGLSLGVEMANGNDDIRSGNISGLRGNNLQMGGTNGDVVFNTLGTYWVGIKSGNDQGVLQDHKSTSRGWIAQRAAVTGETPNKKVSDYVLKVSPNVSGATPIEDWAHPVFLGSIAATTASKTYKFWLYNDMGITLNDVTAKDDVWLKAVYVKAYDDTSEYVYADAFSAEIDILDAADADDWDYLQVTCQPAVASNVYLYLYVSTYAAAVADIFIDPTVVIT